MNTDMAVTMDPVWLNESMYEGTTPDPYPHVQASYKWLAAIGGVIVVLFIAAVAGIVIRVRQKNKEKSPPAVKRWKPPARCSSLPENDKAVMDAPSLPSLEYRDPADLIQDYKWYSIDKPQDDSDVLNVAVPPLQPPPSPKKSAASGPTSPTVSFSDEVPFKGNDKKVTENINPAKTVSDKEANDQKTEGSETDQKTGLETDKKTGGSETIDMPDETPECYDTYL